MALIKCKECSQSISSDAEKCPHCGKPVPQGPSRLKILLLGSVAVAIGMAVFRDKPAPEPAKPPATPAELAQKAKEERTFQTVVAGARWLKENTKNPASFELVSVVMIGDDVICYEYRGTNSFNAVVPNYRVITKTVNSGNAKDWNRYCAGKSGTDYTYAKHAL